MQTKPYRYEGSRRWSANPEDDRCGDGSIRATESTGRGDETPRHPMHQGAGGYVSSCTLCWLGFSHTEAAHEQQVALPSIG
ncbi:MAG TPA: hypothetical protein VFB81_01640 [Myxococcales bacterium]|nr:hypothetical protein [Myxococcales bacterium]